MENMNFEPTTYRASAFGMSGAAGVLGTWSPITSALGASCSARIQRHDLVSTLAVNNVVVRDRQAAVKAATKGHVDFATSIPGTPAWSPPPC